VALVVGAHITPQWPNLCKCDGFFLLCWLKWPVKIYSSFSDYIGNIHRPEDSIILVHCFEAHQVASQMSGGGLGPSGKVSRGLRFIQTHIVYRKIPQKRTTKSKWRPRRPNSCSLDKIEGHRWSIFHPCYISPTKVSGESIVGP
jgi:hypothetical protein